MVPSDFFESIAIGVCDTRKRIQNIAEYRAAALMRHYPAEYFHL